MEAGGERAAGAGEGRACPLATVLLRPSAATRTIRPVVPRHIAGLALALALVAAAAGVGDVDGAVGTDGDAARVVEAAGDGLDRRGLRAGDGDAVDTAATAATAASLLLNEPM